MTLKRSLMGKLLLLVSVRFVLLCTKALQAEAQSDLITPSQQPLSLDMTTTTTVTPAPPPPPPPPTSYGKFISFNSICHSDITLKVI
jgi:hypothetical protein